MRRRLLPLPLVAAALSLCACGEGGSGTTAHIPASAPAWQSEAVLQAPESVAYDPHRARLYVSNVAGEPLGRDGVGFISVLGLDGAVQQLRWVDGLDAPKGLAVSGDTLYAADLDTLLVIDIDAGIVRERHTVPGARMLNGIDIADNGDVYVSDMLTNTIHLLSRSGGRLVPWLRRDELAAPNGLLLHEDALLIATWGTPEADFSTKVPGHIVRVRLADQAIGDLGSTAPIGNLDGFVADGGEGYFLTDWIAGKLLHADANGRAREVLAPGRNPADLEYIAAQRLLVIPLMGENRVVAYRLP